MKEFTTTPSEFQSGKAARLASQIFKDRNRKLGPPKPRKTFQQMDRQIGTITPENFGAGRPFWGKRVRDHRDEPVPTLKPLPEALVDRLLETDEEGIDDPKAYALGAQPDPNAIQDTLRDELVDRGWRGIRVRQEDDNEWVVEAGVIDNDHRAQWSAAGARVAPTPEERPDLRMKLMRLFRAAAKRAGMQIETATLEDLRPAHEGIDLHADLADFEDDTGDWNVAIRFLWAPGNKFWSKASQALGYETKPYQRPPLSTPAATAAPAAPTPDVEIPAVTPEEVAKYKDWVKLTTGPV